MAPNAEWERNAALLRNLSAMREKIKVLERAVKVLGGEQTGQSSRDASALTRSS
jgi:UDP-3-O-[3-hydroxymyristoyl] glucosamine N-acyltransferase